MKKLALLIALSTAFFTSDLDARGGHHGGGHHGGGHHGNHHGHHGGHHHDHHGNFGNNHYNSYYRGFGLGLGAGGAGIYSGQPYYYYNTTPGYSNYYYTEPNSGSVNLEFGF